MRAFTIGTLLTFIALQAYAQNDLSGTVRDGATGETLPGAHVYIADLQKGAITGSDGSYEIRNLPKGTFLVEVGYISYSTQVIKVAVDGETTLDVALAHAVTEMSEVVITGTSAGTRRELSPVPTIVIKDLGTGESPSTNLVDALANHPGIAQITTGGAISKPVIRGLGYNRVVVLNNNIRQEGQQWGDEHGIEIDEYSVDRVEIIKGPGSLMYGSDAMAGVIHMLPPKPVEPGKIVGSVLANYQTNNHLQGYSAMNAGNISDINWLARVSGKLAGNFRNDYDGRVYNSGFEELDFNASVGINKKWGYSQVHVSRFHQKIGMVEGERDDSGHFVKPVAVNDTTLAEQRVTDEDLKGYQIGIPYQDVSHWQISSTSKYYMEHSSLSVNLGFQRNGRKEFDNVFDADEEELYFLLNTFTYDVKYVLPEIDEWRTSLGVSGMQQSSYNKGEEFLIPEYDLFDAGIFAFTRKSFGNLHVSGGVRYDVRNLHSMPLYLDGEDEPTDDWEAGAWVKFKDFSSTFSNVSASVGGSYEMGERWTVKLNFSRGFRSPNMAELGSNGRHEGTFRYELGNSRLESETSFQVDAGLSYDSEHVSFELAVFNNSIQDYIFLQKLNSVFGGDSIVNALDPAPTFEFVQGNANLYGGELVIDVHPHPLDWLHFENSFSMVRGKQLHQPDSTRYLPFMPAPKVKSELRANFKKVGSFLRNFYIGVDVTHHFKQTQVLSAYGTETPTPAYTLLNAGFGADVMGAGGQTLLTVAVAGGNLMDVAYQSHLNRLKYAPENVATGRMGVYNMGRNVSVRILVPLTFRKVG